jgi:PadR family transcriptional regulator PadR
VDRDAPLGTFEEQVLLAVLRSGPDPIGMDVRREIESVTGRDVTIGAVYATLDRLEEKGFLQSRRTQGDGGRRRVFAIARAGAEALAATRAMRDRLWHGIALGDLLEGE